MRWHRRQGATLSREQIAAGVALAQMLHDMQRGMWINDERGVVMYHGIGAERLGALRVDTLVRARRDETGASTLALDDGSLGAIYDQFEIINGAVFHFLSTVRFRVDPATDGFVLLPEPRRSKWREARARYLGLKTGVILPKSEEIHELMADLTGARPA